MDEKRTKIAGRTVFTPSVTRGGGPKEQEESAAVRSGRYHGKPRGESCGRTEIQTCTEHLAAIPSQAQGRNREPVAEQQALESSPREEGKKRHAQTGQTEHRTETAASNRLAKGAGRERSGTRGFGR